MVHERRVAVPDDTRYLEAGTGWAVVLLHAFPVTADMWRAQLDRAPKGFHFLAPDLRGGSIDAMAANVLRLLDHLRIDTAVIGGLSMGGYVTFGIYRQAPERFNGMVLADTRAAADTPEAREARTRLIALAKEKGPVAVAEEMMPKLLGATARRNRPGLAAEVRALAALNSAERVVDALTAMMHRPDSSAGLPRISCKTLVVCGDEDAATPLTEVAAMQDRIPRSRLVVLHGAGHLSNVEQPEEFSRALSDFLASPI